MRVLCFIEKQHWALGKITVRISKSMVFWQWLDCVHRKNRQPWPLRGQLAGKVRSYDAFALTPWLFSSRSGQRFWSCSTYLWHRPRFYARASQGGERPGHSYQWRVWCGQNRVRETSALVCGRGRVRQSLFKAQCAFRLANTGPRQTRIVPNSWISQFSEHAINEQQ